MLPLLVEGKELFTVLDSPDLIIVHISQPDSFERMHIPGAIFVHPSDLVSGIKPATGTLPELDRLKALFARIGYRPDKHIVACDDEGGGWAGRFIWTLDVIGHEHSSLLNGGIIAWVGDDLPVTTATTPATPTTPDFDIDRRVIAAKEDVLRSLENDNEIIWDARSVEEYDGTKVFARRGGHIPGAINLDWMHAMDRSNHLRIREDIRQLLESVGLVRDKKVITHCQTHHRSGLTYFVGKHLGYDIRAYDGSWSEWGNEPDTPIELTPP